MCVFRTGGCQNKCGTKKRCSPGALHENQQVLDAGVPNIRYFLRGVTMEHHAKHLIFRSKATVLWGNRTSPAQEEII